MNSTDLPVTEYWDPELGYYDVPIAADGVPYDVWWPAYEHIAEIEWITTGRTWGWPDGLFGRQLTTGIEICTCIEVPYGDHEGQFAGYEYFDDPNCRFPHQAPTEPSCSCQYHAMRWVLPLSYVETLRHTIIDVRGLHTITWFSIVDACPQHGDRPW